MSRILVADCRDSFVHTIVGYLRAEGAQVWVRPSETLTIDEAVSIDPDGVLLSPGPGLPEEAKICHQLLDHFAGAVSMLGVCLGHQVIASYWGGEVVRAEQLRHGETSEVTHDRCGVFAGLSQPFTATRYHSLSVDPATVPDCLAVTATTEDGVVMGLRHRQLDVEGVQFHPEAILTEHGRDLLRNWLRRCEPPAEARRA
ncbi:anthranilate synthase component II [Natronoglycomyces albus]|uniref:Aminodeoxychorismate/anthranilate synthase component II n=1 Tax=Natronoglycomyces albus TaxID=2811108 RepID=A0A895XJ90_9ACTN|nr:aminodeoxychorismate/anthranilate synthase component II [Natronoglycomyces albus]QSB05404.1 aminodeoxychorismate/anthranilate synthase component II [Natronoglycomyces albus]